MNGDDNPMNDWKEYEYTKYTFSDQFDKDMEKIEQAEKKKKEVKKRD